MATKADIKALETKVTEWQTKYECESDDNDDLREQVETLEAERDDAAESTADLVDTIRAVHDAGHVGAFCHCGFEICHKAAELE